MRTTKVENDVGEVGFGVFRFELEDERGGLPSNLRAGEREVIELNQVDGLVSDLAGGSGVRKGSSGGGRPSSCRVEKSAVMTLEFLLFDFGVGFDVGSRESARVSAVSDCGFESPRVCSRNLVVFLPFRPTSNLSRRCNSNITIRASSLVSAAEDDDIGTQSSPIRMFASSFSKSTSPSSETPTSSSCGRFQRSCHGAFANAVGISDRVGPLSPDWAGNQRHDSRLDGALLVDCWIWIAFGTSRSPSLCSSLGPFRP